MRRLATALLLAAVIGPPQALAQAAPTSDAQAVSLAQQSIAALAGGISIKDVTLSANVISTLSSDNDVGSGTLWAKGFAESRIDLALNTGIRSDVRNATNGVPAGAWRASSGVVTAYAQHNCWADAAWFSPVLSSLTQTVNPNFVFSYVGQEQHIGTNTQHIHVFQAGIGEALSAVDFYLDLSSHLPVAMAFNSHPDNDINTNIVVEIDFTNYQAINGAQVPFQIRRSINGDSVLQFTVTSIAFNTGLLDSLFNLQ